MCSPAELSSVMGRNPFDEIEEMFDRMGRQLETGTIGELQSIPVDVQDQGETYVVAADLPGYDTGDVDLTFGDGNLRIDASRDEELDAMDENGTYVHRERSQSASRTVRIPEPVDEDEITATYNHGTLTVELPKARAGDDGHQIDIN